MSIKQNNQGMLYPPVGELAEKTGSRYQLVNLVAYRARKIAAEAKDSDTPLDKKPVSMAIDEVYSGKTTIVPTDSFADQQ